MKLYITIHQLLQAQVRHKVHAMSWGNKSMNRVKGGGGLTFSRSMGSGRWRAIGGGPRCCIGGPGRGLIGMSPMPAIATPPQQQQGSVGIDQDKKEAGIRATLSSHEPIYCSCYRLIRVPQTNMGQIIGLTCPAAALAPTR